MQFDQLTNKSIFIALSRVKIISYDERNRTLFTNTFYVSVSTLLNYLLNYKIKKKKTEIDLMKSIAFPYKKRNAYTAVCCTN